MSLPEIRIPTDFDWKFYVSYNPDLRKAGILTEEQAIRHFLDSGHSEDRQYASQQIVPNPRYKNASVLVVGTSREIEVFEDSDLAACAEEKLPIICINTAFHYFNHISCLFVNGRFKDMEKTETERRNIDEIYTPHAWPTEKSKVRTFKVDTNTSRYSPEISTDLNNILPHGPTTLLDIVFPFCAFHQVRTIQIIGAEYNIENGAHDRHMHDKAYIDRSIPTMDRTLEYTFALRKLDVWNEYFRRAHIDCFALSEKSKTPFRKKSLLEVLCK